ncbi:MULTISPECIES: 2-oxoglutarate dehydrogenase complex dihydrolipoyllysine-residue succinyltransferase [Pseudomonadota]|jgi:2-oxoglutarate dehydrogenase E2 component (dihydrolipoamide succinyltransferase)|uniref:2-oxoglutarate dehydrogenase complex dihydrolipoyllysine-residue succinyltransferase n=2 Tax=Pseudomonadota TaxID=1224 RepID=UPI00076A0910|nr:MULTISPECIES: 2-oxoglutarate dehydrogenase complex dihydrolipoyllysine-residue succinyltransferase [Pseudomonadota]MAF63501.1 dihydrolipoyllysine-residue succinyltransferase [Blastomonas sp.]MBA4781446.1 2-oxoglutarate dehydrogenase complex dihydrolipoyllysine-residue succinyltransferase [Blastomonas sp.]|tara:strand:- start:60006 stop:61253 length:1248 start_codon:yes stop_codon:yes gene_type:complete
MSIEVKVPVLGESISEATIGEWLKKPGDTVAADEPIASLETDKVAVEVPAPAAGVLGQLIFSEGDTVQVGSILTTIESSGAAVATAAAAPQPAIAKSEATPAPAAVAAPAPAPTGEPVSLSPAVRRLVLEHGLDPTSIKGTGKDGRLTKEDVLAAAAEAAKAAPAPVAAAPAAAPVASGAAGRETERVRMTRIRQTIAKRLKSAQDTAAMLTTFNDVDMTAVMEARNTYKDLFEKKHGVRLGFMGFFAKAACLALKDVPSVNAQIEGDEIVYHNYADISVAVSAPNGLVVPVIRNAESLSFAGIEKTIADFGKRAKDGTLKMEEMQGGTFTISNGGVFGSLMSTPIINPPQSAVLGLHRIDQRPVVMPDGSIAARPMMYLALSYDHRLIDGREAVTFLKTIKEAIEDPTRLLIDL